MSPVLHTKHKGNWPFGSKKKLFNLALTGPVVSERMFEECG